MLKHRKTHIVSRLFDTIHKISLETASETVFETASEPEIIKKYNVSVPNERFVLRKDKPILICTYQVRTDGLYPFLMFLLKTTQNSATFIKIDTHKQLKYAAIAYIQTILPNASLSYSGFYETEKNNILILSTEETNTIQENYSWATSFEIINIKKIMNSNVDPVVIEFFLSNPAFLIVKDEGNRIYESPMVGYKTHENTCAENEMDIYRETIIPELGKSYYIDKDIPVTSLNIMRIAFFAGKMVLKNGKSYDSVFCGDKYIIQNYDQHVVLSVFNSSDL